MFYVSGLYVLCFLLAFIFQIVDPPTHISFLWKSYRRAGLYNFQRYGIIAYQVIFWPVHLFIFMPVKGIILLWGILKKSYYDDVAKWRKNNWNAWIKSLPPVIKKAHVPYIGIVYDVTFDPQPYRQTHTVRYKIKHPEQKIDDTTQDKLLVDNFIEETVNIDSKDLAHMQIIKK